MVPPSPFSFMCDDVNDHLSSQTPLQFLHLCSKWLEQGLWESQSLESLHPVNRRRSCDVKPLVCSVVFFALSFVTSKVFGVKMLLYCLVHASEEVCIFRLCGLKIFVELIASIHVWRNHKHFYCGNLLLILVCAPVGCRLLCYEVSFHVSFPELVSNPFPRDFSYTPLYGIWNTTLPRARCMISQVKAPILNRAINLPIYNILFSCSWNDFGYGQGKVLVTVGPMSNHCLFQKHTVHIWVT